MSSSSTVRRTAAAVAAGAAIACVATAVPANAAVPHHGKVYFTIGSIGAADTPAVVMHGALNAVGKDPDSNSDNYDVLKFKTGTMRINHPESKGKYVPYMNKKTCFVSFTETGSFTVNRGTGSYAGIEASGTYRGHGSGFSPRSKSGACNFNADPGTFIFTVYAHGTLK